ncbi:9887_t:CDS:1 [Entrophospora sp. SA101]|nr:9887_t:CDS:1 [Entrophospora sp. SA101]CAJ0858005.1 11355_t:CDS:1 [Entrophospora sp. SA101]
MLILPFYNIKIKIIQRIYIDNNNIFEDNYYNSPSSPSSPSSTSPPHNLRFSIAIAPTKIFRSQSTDSHYLSKSPTGSLSSSYSNLSSSVTSICFESHNDEIVILSANSLYNYNGKQTRDYYFDDDDDNVNDEGYYTSSYFSSSNTKPIDIPMKAQKEDSSLEPNKGTFGEDNGFPWELT